MTASSEPQQPEQRIDPHGHIWTRIDGDETFVTIRRDSAEQVLSTETWHTWTARRRARRKR